MLLALQFLPSPHIERAFEMLAERAKTTATTALIDYVRRQWMNNPTFGVDDWSVFRQSIRKNNDVEGIYTYFYPYKATRNMHICEKLLFHLAIYIYPEVLKRGTVYMQASSFCTIIGLTVRIEGSNEI